MPDFLLHDHGSILCLIPMTAEGRNWADEYLDPDAQTFGQGVVIEPRYIEPILEGINEAELEVLS